MLVYYNFVVSVTNYVIFKLSDDFPVSSYLIYAIIKCIHESSGYVPVSHSKILL